jgi:hypothetical protein
MIVRDIITRVSNVHNRQISVPRIILSVRQHLYAAAKSGQPAAFELMSEDDPTIQSSKWYQDWQYRRKDTRAEPRPSGKNIEVGDGGTSDMLKGRTGDGLKGEKESVEDDKARHRPGILKRPHQTWIDLTDEPQAGPSSIKIKVEESPPPTRRKIIVPNQDDPDDQHSGFDFPKANWPTPATRLPPPPLPPVRRTVLAVMSATPRPETPKPTRRKKPRLEPPETDVVTETDIGPKPELGTETDISCLRRSARIQSRATTAEPRAISAACPSKTDILRYQV